jgi:serine/threonine protein kinase
MLSAYPVKEMDDLTDSSTTQLSVMKSQPTAVNSQSSAPKTQPTHPVLKPRIHPTTPPPPPSVDHSVVLKKKSVKAENKTENKTTSAKPVSNTSSKSASNTSSKSASNTKSLGFHSFKHHDYMVHVPDYYMPKDLLGHGAYSVVIRAHDKRQKSDNPFVALKVCKHAFNNPMDAKRLLREISILSYLKHDYIIRLLDLPKPVSIPKDPLSTNQIVMVLEHMDTSLFRMVPKNSDAQCSTPLTHEHISYIMCQIFSALNYMHRLGFVHRDLKPNNILINKDVTTRICDFGLARYIGSGQNKPSPSPIPSTSDSKSNDSDFNLTQYVVTRWYRAPEVLCRNSHYDFKIDMWAAGLILAELMNGGNPLLTPEDSTTCGVVKQMEHLFSVLGTPSDDDLRAICSHSDIAYDMISRIETKYTCVDWTKKFPKHFHQYIPLLQKLLAWNPQDRYSAEQALNDPTIIQYTHSINPSYTMPSKPYDTTFEDVLTRTLVMSDNHKDKERARVLIKDYIWQYRLEFHPDLRPDYEHWRSKYTNIFGLVCTTNTAIK